MKNAANLLSCILFHPTPWKRTIITLIYCMMGLFANFFLFQVFCVPVWPAVVVCMLFLFAIVLMPFVKNPSARMVLYFLAGIGVPVCMYCIWFLMDPWEGGSVVFYYIFAYLLLGLFFGLGLLAYIPVYLLYHTYRYFKEGRKQERIAFMTGCVLPLLALLLYLVEFRKQYASFQEAVVNRSVEKLSANHFTERLLGIGFKYHTQLEFVYDGWRPPMHDPFLNLGLWLYAGSSYPFNDLSRIKYYSLLFPDIPLKVNCPCSYMSDGATYLENDWREDLYYDKTNSQNAN